MDVQHALQARLEDVADPESDPEARRLMAQVALAKATSFIALLRADGRLLDVTDAPLTSAGLDRLGRRREGAVADFELDHILAGRDEALGDGEHAEGAFYGHRRGELAELNRHKRRNHNAGPNTGQ